MKSRKTLVLILVLTLAVAILTACQQKGSDPVERLESSNDSTVSGNTEVNRAVIVGKWYCKEMNGEYEFTTDNKFTCFVNGELTLSGSYDLWGSDLTLTFMTNGQQGNLSTRFSVIDGKWTLRDGGKSYEFVRR